LESLKSRRIIASHFNYTLVKSDKKVYEIYTEVQREQAQRCTGNLPLFTTKSQISKVLIPA